MSFSQTDYDPRDLSDAELRQAFARCFNSREGRIVLAVLKRMTLERYLGPDSTPEALRHLEGQRQLVGYMLSLLSQPNLKS